MGSKEKAIGRADAKARLTPYALLGCVYGSHCREEYVGTIGEGSREAAPYTEGTSSTHFISYVDGGYNEEASTQKADDPGYGP